MISFFIQAADVLFFKDGREIAAGSEYSAASVFPPNPGTLYGALRSAFIAQQENHDFSRKDFGIDEQMALVLGTQKELGNLTIKAFGLAKQNANGIHPLLPMPNDILKRKNPEQNKDKTISFSKPKALSHFGVQSNAPLKGLEKLWITEDEGTFFEPLTGFLEADLFNQYLTQPNHHSFLQALGEQAYRQEAPDYFVSESRMGIAIDYSKNTVKESKLFTTPFIRPNAQEGIGFWLSIDVEKPLGSTEHFNVRLGGEGKLARFTSCSEIREIKKPTVGPETKQIKLVLSTPAVFEHGWIPDGFDPENGHWEKNDLGVQLIGASIGKPTIVGGWNMASNQPKTSKKAVSPGSIYYLECQDAQKAVDYFHANSLCKNEDHQKQGLGITYTGVF